MDLISSSLQKMAIYPIPDDLKPFFKKEGVLIFDSIFFKKTEITYGKGESFQIKTSTFNVPIEASNVCNILQRPISNGLIIVTLKQDLIYKDHIYLDAVRQYVIRQVIPYLKPHKLCEDISISKGLP